MVQTSNRQTGYPIRPEPHPENGSYDMVVVPGDLKHCKTIETTGGAGMHHESTEKLETLRLVYRYHVPRIM